MGFQGSAWAFTMIRSTLAVFINCWEEFNMYRSFIVKSPSIDLVTRCLRRRVWPEGQSVINTAA